MQGDYREREASEHRDKPTCGARILKEYGTDPQGRLDLLVSTTTEMR